MAAWLFKTEPDVFSIRDLKAQKKAVWDGVRNYAARNFLRDEVKLGDLVFIYHSSCPEPGVAGLATVSKAGFPDHSAFDKKHKYFDPKSEPTAPRWFSVEVAFQAEAQTLVPLAWMREDAVTQGLECFRLNRLSISHVTAPQAARLQEAAGFSSAKGKR